MGAITYLLTLIFLMSGSNLKLVHGSCETRILGITLKDRLTYSGNTLICTDITADEINHIYTGGTIFSVIIKNSYIPILSQPQFQQFELLKSGGLLFLILNGNNISHIEVNTFSHFPNLIALDLAHNKLIRIEENALNGSFIWLDLSYNNLTKLEYITNSNLKELIISNNQIKSIRDNEFKNVELTKLDLSNNYISSLNGLNDIETLENLNLSYNLIDTIDSNNFQKLKSLEYLDLSNNQIKIITKNSLNNLKKLTHLNLENNNLQTFSLFENNKLSNLILSNNYLLQVNCIHMHGHVKLSKNFLTTICHFGERTRYIDLSINAITKVENNTFSHVKNLIYLILCHNAISKIEVDAFKNLKTLESLKLNDNAITHLEMSTFSDLKNLENLDLSSNRISTLQLGVFTGLDNLKTLNLSKNHIEYIQSEIFLSVRNLEKLYLHNNPLITFDRLHNLNDFKELSLSFVKIGCQALKEKLESMSDKGIVEGHVKNGPNINGIACDPNNKKVEKKLNDAEHFMNVMLNLQSMFILTIVLFIVFFISLTVSWLHKRKTNKINPALNLIETNVG